MSSPRLSPRQAPRQLLERETANRRGNIILAGIFERMIYGVWRRTFEEKKESAAQIPTTLGSALLHFSSFIVCFPALYNCLFLLLISPHRF